jgi:hypothetical protein
MWRLRNYASCAVALCCEALGKMIVRYYWRSRTFFAKDPNIVQAYEPLR